MCLYRIFYLVKSLLLLLCIIGRYKIQCGVRRKIGLFQLMGVLRVCVDLEIKEIVEMILVLNIK